MLNKWVVADGWGAVPVSRGLFWTPTLAVMACMVAAISEVTELVRAGELQ